MIDDRGAELSGEKDWIRNNLCLAGKTGQLKAIDFLRLSRDRGVTAYLFKDIFGPPPLTQSNSDVDGALNALLDALVLSLAMECNVDGRPPSPAAKKEFAQHAEQMALLLSRFEKDVPKTFCDILLHELLHVPYCVFRWGSVRNFWCFFGERYVGWLTHFINQRNHAARSLANGVSRFNFTRRIDPDTRDSLVDRLFSMKTPITLRGFLVPTSALLDKRGEGKGAGRLSVNTNWRNTRVLHSTGPVYAEVKTFLQLLQQLNLAPCPDDREVQWMEGGVEVDGVQWKKNDSCLFKDENGQQAYGVVQGCIWWQEEMRSHLIFRVKTYKIVSIDRGILTVKAKSRWSGVHFLWQNLTHKCKSLDHQGGIEDLKTVLRVVRTHTTTMGECKANFPPIGL